MLGLKGLKKSIASDATVTKYIEFKVLINAILVILNTLQRSAYEVYK